MVPTEHKMKQVNAVENYSRQLRLISVVFKEASMDSPSFRAFVNFYQTRVEILEDWLEKTVGFYEQKYRASFEDFRRAFQSLQSQLLPSPILLGSGFVRNQAFAPALVEGFSKDYHEFYAKVLRILFGEDFGRSNAFIRLTRRSLESYRTARKNFDYYQVKYDNALSAHLATNAADQPTGSSNGNTPINTPAALAEASLQLFELHKSYLKASLDLVDSVSAMQLSLDSFVSESMDILKERTVFNVSESSQPVDLSPIMNDSLQEYNLWVTNAIEGAQGLKPDIERAKKQAFDYTVSRAKPSKNNQDYATYDIDPASLLDKTVRIPDITPEKSGWLYMKTQVGKPSREIWVRRWCFLQNGVFGMFLLSPSKTYVEETNKFGVFLTNARYLKHDSRAYCFELNIFGNTPTNNSSSQVSLVPKNIHLVFQASSLKDLKSWLSTFEMAKKYVMNLERDTLEYEIAFKLFPPQFIELASSTTTTMDRQLTTLTQETTSLYDKLNCTFSEYDVLSFGKERMYRYHVPTTPIFTKMTQLAVLANSFTKGSWFPTAVLANIWGTTNWSDYAVGDQKKRQSASVIRDNTLRSMQMQSTEYPLSYPSELKIQDLHFKCLFNLLDLRMYEVSQDLLLFKFESFWCPNKAQKFSSTCYVTANNIYPYVDMRGFVCMTKIALDDVISVEKMDNSKNYILFYYKNATQIKIQVLFTDANAVAAKLNYLVEKKIANSHKNLQESLAQMEDIDREYHEKHLEESKDQKVNANYGDNSQLNEKSQGKQKMGLTFHTLNGEIARLIGSIKKLALDYSVSYQQDYDLPSKALVHILFGDRSDAFPRCLFLARKNSVKQMNWMWVADDKDETGTVLHRDIQFELDITDNFLSSGQIWGNFNHQTMTVRQILVKALENRYYEVEERPITIKVPFCRLMRVKVKYIIMESYDPEKHIELKLKMSSDRSLFYVFYKLEFVDPSTGDLVSDKTLSLWERLCRNWALHFTKVEFFLLRSVIRSYLERIGKHGKVIRAIKLCGLLGIVERDSQADTNGSQSHNEKKSGLENLNNYDDNKIDVRYSFAVLVKIFLKLIIYRITNYVLVLLRFIFGLLVVVTSEVKSVSRTLVFGLSVSAFLNLILASMATKHYWSVKKADDFYDKLVTGKGEHMMKRAISLDDLDVLTRKLGVQENNLALEQFKVESTLNDQIKYRETRKELALKRNELLVELKLLQNMEVEMIKGDYRSFLIREVSTCSKLIDEMPEVWKAEREIHSYCDSCTNELERFGASLL